MPTVLVDSQRPALAIDGLDRPDLAAALWRWELAERGRLLVTGAFEFEDRTGAWRTGDPLRLGAAVRLALGPEGIFDGQVLALQVRAGAAAAPTVGVQVRGRRPRAALPRDPAPRLLRVGADLLQAQVRREGAPVVVRLDAVAAASWATGAQALRAGSTVIVQGLGPAFDGRFRLQGVTLRFDPAQGLQLDLSGRR